MTEPLAVLLGPTASGKEAAAATAAPGLRAEIVTCDSVKPYRGLSIASAAPPPSHAARVPHHLVAVLDPSERLHAARWLELAEAAFAEIRARGRRPFVVGGTALYLKALLHGLFEGPARDDALRARLTAREATEPGWLHRRLTEVDPASAARIHANDLKRLLRAVEVYESTGRPISALQKEWERAPARPTVLVGLRRTRDDLRARIRARITRMLDCGLIDEVRALHEAGALGPTAAEAIGVKEVVSFLEKGDPSPAAMDALAEEIRAHTWGLARRQLTWFRRFGDVTWIDVPPDEPAATTGARVAAALRS